VKSVIGAFEKSSLGMVSDAVLSLATSGMPPVIFTLGLSTNEDFMHYYQFNIKTYIASTAHLTNEEDLTYRRLIDYYYDTEQPIPSALPVLCRRLRLALPDVESVLKEFFVETENGWAHTYIDNEISTYKAFIARQKANGSKGGRASKPSANPVLTQAEPSAKPTSNNKQVTINKEQERDISFSTLETIEKIFLEKTKDIWSESVAKKEADKFYNFYASKGWKVGKEKMKSLPHAIGGWISRNDKPDFSPKHSTNEIKFPR